MIEQPRQAPPARAGEPRKVADYRHGFRGIWDRTPGGVCRIRIFVAGEQPPVIVCSELGRCPTSSVTSAAEVLAAEVIARHFPHRFEFPEPVVWIEHHPDRHGRPHLDEFARVAFASWTPRKVRLGGRERASLGTPEWRLMWKHEVAVLIGDAEMEVVG